MLILNVQFWEGDREQACQLVKLMADMEPEKRYDVTLLMSARFDCAHDQPTLEYAAKKFKVETFRSQPHRTGWPGGPNDLMAQSYMWCVENTRNRKIDANGVFFIESDAIPLDMNWLNHLLHEWKTCVDSGKQVLGCWLTQGDCNVEHVNGNMIIHKDFWRDNRSIFTPGSGGWDADGWHFIKPHAMPSRLIWSDYGLGKPDYNPWKGCDYLFSTKRFRGADNPLYGQDLNPVWMHGPKIIDGIDCVRAKFGLKPRL